MIKTLFTVFILLPLFSFEQTINTRIYGVDSFQNDFWNNWRVKNKPDTSRYLIDIYGNTTKIRYTMSYFEQVYDNGLGYLAGKSIFPDTVLREGLYNSGNANLTMMGLDDSSLYQITLFGSRNRPQGEATIFSIQGIPKDTGTLQTDSNVSKIVSFNGVTSTKGKLVISIQNKATYSYLNAIQLVGIPKHQTVKAIIRIDSTNIHYPRSYVIVTSDSSKNRFASFWSTLSGPSIPIYNQIGDSMWISGLIPGSYKLQLTVQDSVGNTDSTTTTVTVNPFICPVCAVCPPPVICAPQRTVVSFSINWLTGVITLTYSDGTVQSFTTSH